MDWLSPILRCAAGARFPPGTPGNCPGSGRWRRATARLPLLCMVFLLPFVVAPCSYAWRGKAVAVESGGRITVQRPEGLTRVVLYGIQCPLSGQPLGNKALYLTCWLALGKQVEVTPVGLESGAEIPALVKVQGSRDFLNAQLIGYGMARLKNRHPVIPLCREWKKLEKLARINRIGLWAKERSIRRGGKRLGKIKNGDGRKYSAHTKAFAEGSKKAFHDEGDDSTLF